MRARQIATSSKKPSRLARFAADTRGNVFIIMAFSMIPLTAATGMAIDYSRAARLQTKVNSAADAAALAAVTTPMMSQTTHLAAEAAGKMFISQVGALNGMTWKETLRATPTVTTTLTTYTLDFGAFKVVVTDTDITGLTRVATVSYDALSDNAFKGVLGLSKSGIGGSATAKAKIAPNIDFFMLLDVSSSMALPITSAGIASMKKMTGGCAFACHQSNPDTTEGTRQYVNGKLVDFYTAAHNAGIVLRVDNGKTAIQDTIDRAVETMASNKATYRFSISTFAKASNFNNLANIYSTLADARSQAGTAQAVIVKKNDSGWDRQTEHDDSLAKAAALMPLASGNGSRKPGMTPQSILFLVTDGMRDEDRSGRQLGAILQTQCTAIKARLNTRIAVLYTTYDPASIAGDDWSQRNVAGRLPDLAPALKACASPDLFFEVTTDQSISDAMRKLFDAATNTARITQ